MLAEEHLKNGKVKTPAALSSLMQHWSSAHQKRAFQWEYLPSVLAKDKTSDALTNSSQLPEFWNETGVFDEPYGILYARIVGARIKVSRSACHIA
jgi:hypothetical protein